MEQCWNCENFEWCSSEEMDCSICSVKGSEKTSLLKKATNFIINKKLKQEFWNWCNGEVTNEKIILFYDMKVGVQYGKKIKVQ